MLFKAKYRTRMAENEAELISAQQLRYRAFIAEGGADAGQLALDRDAFDDICCHMLVEEIKTGKIVATFRMLALGSGAEIELSYSAQYYDLERLKEYEGPMVEIGRFCVEPGIVDPEILRSAWGAVTRLVDQDGIELLFGCSSFKGTDAEGYMDAFAMLKEKHLAPKRWLPKIKAPKVFQFAKRLRRQPDKANALRTMPPLLRSYLTMGGWVSDHAVVDQKLNTLHVFTGLEIARIPPARARALRAVAG